MTERMIVNRVRKLKELEAQQKEIEEQIEALKAEIKADMQSVVRQIKRCSIKRFNSYCFHSCWMFRSFYPIPFWQFILRTQWLRQINCRSHQGTIQVHNH